MTPPDDGSATARGTPSPDPMDRVWATLPESKLELWQGRLLIGSSLLGSQALLGYLLQTLGVPAALPLVALDAWWEALRAVFPHAPSQAAAPAWTMWAETVRHTLQITAAGPHYDGIHVLAASALGRSVHAALSDGALGICLGRDFVMRLGDDAVTPDLLLITPERFPQLQAKYLDGPADLVIEITMPGHEWDETVLRRQRYAAAAVPEYWIVDPLARSITFFRHGDGTYQEQPLAPEVTDGNAR